MAEKEYQELTAQIDGLKKLIIAGAINRRVCNIYQPFGGTPLQTDIAENNPVLQTYGR